MTNKHKWDKSGERCLNCGDKDWMGGDCKDYVEVPSAVLERALWGLRRAVGNGYSGHSLGMRKILSSRDEIEKLLEKEKAHDR